MDGLVFILIGLFLILSVYAFYPWFNAKIISLIREPTIITLEKTQDILEDSKNKEPNNKDLQNEKTKPSAVLEFLKRFVLYHLQPILQ
jgi:hypothetical protein